MKSNSKVNQCIISRTSLMQKLENNTKSSSCFSSISQEGTNDFTMTMNEIRKAKGRNISQEYSFSKYHPHPYVHHQQVAYNDKENLFSVSIDNISNENKEGDYCELMSRLSIWDRNHIRYNKKNGNENCSQSIFKFEKGNRIHHLSELEKISSSCNIKSSVLNNQIKPMKVKDKQSNMKTYNSSNYLMRYQKNQFNFDVFRQKQFIKDSIANEENNKDNTDTIANANLNEIQSMVIIPNINNNIQPSILNANSNQPQQEHQLMQEREKEKRENYNRDDLIKSYKTLSILYIEKEQYKQIIGDTYKLLNEIKEDYLAHMEALKNQKKQMCQKYSSLKKYTSPNDQSNDYSSQYTDKQEEGDSKEAKKKKKAFEIKEDKMKNYHSYNEIVRKIEEKERLCEQEYSKITNDLTEMIRKNTEEINKINNRYREYNRRYEILKKDQSIYYINLLKQGVDTRNEGLSWILRRLLELNIDIETLQYPNFLNKKQIDYLIHVSKLTYEVYQLNIILKELKIRQNTISNELKKELLETIDCCATQRARDINNNNKESISKKEMIKSNSTKLLNIVNKSFFNLIEKRNQMQQHQINTKEEENEIMRITQSIKQSLKQNTSIAQLNYCVKEENSKSKIIYNSDKTKEYYEIINKLRKRINEVNNILNNLIKEHQTIFKAKYRKYGSSNPKEKNAIMYYEKIKNSLFGSKHVLYIS